VPPINRPEAIVEKAERENGQRSAVVSGGAWLATSSFLFLLQGDSYFQVNDPQAMVASASCELLTKPPSWRRPHATGDFTSVYTQFIPSARTSAEHGSVM